MPSLPRISGSKEHRWSPPLAGLARRTSAGSRPGPPSRTRACRSRSRRRRSSETWWSTPVGSKLVEQRVHVLHLDPAARRSGEEGLRTRADRPLGQVRRASATRRRSRPTGGAGGVADDDGEVVRHVHRVEPEAVAIVGRRRPARRAPEAPGSPCRAPSGVEHRRRQRGPPRPDEPRQQARVPVEADRHERRAQPRRGPERAEQELAVPVQAPARRPDAVARS